MSPSARAATPAVLLGGTFGSVLVAFLAASTSIADSAPPAGDLPTFDRISPEVGSALLRVGAVLLKGQASTAQEAQQAAIAAWGQAGFSYGLGDYNAGGSVVRKQLERNVYDVAAGAPADRPVAAHCEKAYQARIPHFVGFACLRPADQGGELQLVDTAKAAKALPSAVAAKLRRKGIMYLRRMGDAELTPDWTYPTGMWQQRLGTSDLEAARRLLRTEYAALAGEGGAELERLPDGTVVMKWRAAGFARLPRGESGTNSSEPNLAVHSILDNHKSMNYGDGESPLHSTWGDGEEFSEGEIAAFRGALTSAEWVRQRLERGDVVVVNNLRFAHGRLPYSGERRHVGFMSEDVPRGVALPPQQLALL